MQFDVEIEERTSEGTVVLRFFKKWLGLLNDLLLVPMFTSIITDATNSGQSLSEGSNYFFCSLFFTEWMLGFLLASERLKYIKSPARLMDLVSTIPLGGYFQGVRILRLTRLVKLFRFVLRMKRYQGPGRKLFRTVAVVSATAFAGAYTILIVEGSAAATCVPDSDGGGCPMITEFWDALWWSIVTISTVGYGDSYPVTMGGRIVAIILIFIGVGVFGYIAGFMTNLMEIEDDEEEDTQMTRIEKKLDILAKHMNIEEWPKDSSDPYTDSVQEN